MAYLPDTCARNFDKPDIPACIITFYYREQKTGQITIAGRKSHEIVLRDQRPDKWMTRKRLFYNSEI